MIASSCKEQGCVTVRKVDAMELLALIRFKPLAKFFRRTLSFLSLPAQPYDSEKSLCTSRGRSPCWESKRKRSTSYQGGERVALELHLLPSTASPPNHPLLLKEKLFLAIENSSLPPPIILNGQWHCQSFFIFPNVPIASKCFGAQNQSLTWKLLLPSHRKGKGKPALPHRCHSPKQLPSCNNGLSP